MERIVLREGKVAESNMLRLQEAICKLPSGSERQPGKIENGQMNVPAFEKLGKVRRSNGTVAGKENPAAVFFEQKSIVSRVRERLSVMRELKEAYRNIPGLKPAAPAAEKEIRKNLRIRGK